MSFDFSMGAFSEGKKMYRSLMFSEEGLIDSLPFRSFRSRQIIFPHYFFRGFNFRGMFFWEDIICIEFSIFFSARGLRIFIFFIGKGQQSIFTSTSAIAQIMFAFLSSGGGGLHVCATIEVH